jgi:hypothetical protein
MPTEKLVCASIGFYDDWQVEGTTDKVAAVAEPDDDDTTRIGYWRYGESYLLATSSIPSGSTINSITVHSRLTTWENTYGDRVNVFLRLGGTDNDGPIHNVGAHVWANFDDVISRPGGGAWALSDLTTLEVGVEASIWNEWGNCTTLYVVVDYTPPSGGATGNMLLMFT